MRRQLNCIFAAIPMRYVMLQLEQEDCQNYFKDTLSFVRLLQFGVELRVFLTQAKDFDETK